MSRVVIVLGTSGGKTDAGLAMIMLAVAAAAEQEISTVIIDTFPRAPEPMTPPDMREPVEAARRDPRPDQPKHRPRDLYSRKGRR